MSDEHYYYPNLGCWGSYPSVEPEVELVEVVARDTHDPIILFQGDAVKPKTRPLTEADVERMGYDAVFGGWLISSGAHVNVDQIDALTGVEPEPLKTILDEAAEIVSGARRKAYGHPERNFSRIAALWNAYLAGKPNGPLPITDTDVSLLMILMKVARLIETPTHRDSLVDLAGYAATIEMLWSPEDV